MPRASRLRPFPVLCALALALGAPGAPAWAAAARLRAPVRAATAARVPLGPPGASAHRTALSRSELSPLPAVAGAIPAVAGAIPAVAGAIPALAGAIPAVPAVSASRAPSTPALVAAQEPSAQALLPVAAASAGRAAAPERSALSPESALSEGGAAFERRARRPVEGASEGVAPPLMEEAPASGFAGALARVSLAAAAVFGGAPMLAGSLGSLDRSSRRFLEKIRSAHKPGEVVGDDDSAAAGRDLGMAKVEVNRAERALLEGGHFFIRRYADSIHYLYAELGPLPGEGDDARAGRLAAQRGLFYANQKSPRDQARALAHFDEALRFFEDERISTGRVHPYREQVVVFKWNAALNLLSSFLSEAIRGLEARPAVEPRASWSDWLTGRALGRGLARWLGRASAPTAPTPALSEENRRLRDAYLLLRKALEEAYYELGRAPAPLGEAEKAALHRLASGIRAERHLTGKGEADGEVKAGVRALHQHLRALLKGYSPARSPDAAVAGAISAGAFAVEQEAGGTPETKPFPYGRNLSDLARQNLLEPVIGRESEIDQVVDVLLRRKKANPALIGEAGVGKTAVVEGLAQRMARGEVPELAGKEIVQLDLSALVEGTKYRGSVEARLKEVLAALKGAEGKIILFIDELHLLSRLGRAEGQGGVDQYLKPLLGSGGLSVIGATTLDEYRKHIEADGALERRFEPVYVGEMGVEESARVLLGVKAKEESRHGVVIPEATVRAAARWAKRYFPGRRLPDSALDLLGDAAVRLRRDLARGKASGNTLGLEQLARVIERKTGIELARVGDKGWTTEQIEARLGVRVAGQGAAVRAMAELIEVRQSGLDEDERRPLAALFLGPTGVGKTELAKAVAEFFFGDDSAVLRVDMGEFSEEHSIARLIGAPPGYVGFEERGRLSEAVRRRPRQVILLDEIEKAHPKVQLALLPLIDEGRLTDGHGREVDFSNTVVIMTSNLGGGYDVRGEGKPIGFKREEEGGEASSRRRGHYVNAAKKALADEFFGRIGEEGVLVFDNLDREALGGVLDRQLARLNASLARRGVRVELSGDAYAQVLEHAWAPSRRVYGGRPVRQWIQTRLKPLLSAALNRGDLPPGSRAVVEYMGGDWTLRAEPPSGESARREQEETR